MNDSLILDIAGLPVLVRFRYPEFRAFCGQYVLADGSETVFEVCATEDQIKEELAVTSRCMPFEQEQISDVCVCCGKPAKKMVYWGRAY